MAAGERVSSPTEQAEAVADELYDFRDHFVERFGIEKAGEKDAEVSKKMEECLQRLDEIQGDVKNKAQLHYLRGKILNVTSKYSPEAEEALGKAVKLDPRLVEAWNHLGECYWKKEDISAAKNCFTGALNHSKNKVSLRNLSMVLRQLSGPPVEKVKLIEESIERAKEAVQLDITDGTSWLILGNAYVCQTFSQGQNPKALKQAMQAYTQADKDSVARANPDLHFNRAVTYKYIGEYQLALDGFSMASQLDPSWSEAKTKETELLRYLSDVQKMIETKGKMKQKKIDSLSSSISDRDLGPYSSLEYVDTGGKTVALTCCKLAELQPKINAGKLVVGKVVCSINSTDSVPFPVCIVDEDQTAIAVMVNKLAQDAGMKIGDSVAIPEPQLKKVKVSHKETEISFPCIQVDSPRLLVVNGRKLGASKEVQPILSTRAVSD
ncbi:tetratricopeptide repeat protein 5 [Plakobranchus ocellatus]|uniref:Tetratricopeptide repeat protein 5 n=1 Tax=Plakobranchus ocellatus TaxID=259542 RepID=A0AAV4BPJ1_9GAST|nr:tetratricopeptide repeat protein 5 [Plakobranchus ocellatus]